MSGLGSCPDGNGINRDQSAGGIKIFGGREQEQFQTR